MSIFLPDNSPVDEDDLRILTHQLSRSPQGVRAILRRCDEGFPQIILSEPLLSDLTPFPTIYWLTCPSLRKKIAILEDQGWIKQFQEQLNKDRSFRELALEAQKSYLKTRKKMISTVCDVPDYAREVLTEVGIGGVSDLSRIKCLHAHYAHYLATGKNPIGQKIDTQIDTLIDKTICEVECKAG